LKLLSALRALFGAKDRPQVQHRPSEVWYDATNAPPNDAGEVVIRWSQQSAYLFIEGDEQGALVHTNLPDTVCPRCKALVSDGRIKPTEYANHRCGNKSGRA